MFYIIHMYMSLLLKIFNRSVVLGGCSKLGEKNI